MEINRKGTVTEYKRGHYYLSHTEWQDGHCEIEVHHCVPRILWHSCDPKQLETAKEFFSRLQVDDNENISVLPELTSQS